MNENENDILLVGAALGGLALLLFTLSRNKNKPTIAPMEIIPKNNVTKKGEIIVSIPATKMDEYPALMVFGGINYATSQWMYDTMPKDILYRSVAIFANYNSNFDAVRKTLDQVAAENGIKLSSISLFGFSAGGQQVWKHAGPDYKVIGAIDPTTYPSDAVKAASNVIMAYNKSNWGSLPKIANALPAVGKAVADAGGIARDEKISHPKFPGWFWETYKSKILA